MLAIPAPNKVMKPPTDFDDGKTFVYINGNAVRGKNHWVKLRVSDSTSLNRAAIGAKLIVNGKQLRRVRAGGGGGSSSSTDQIVGLGAGALQTVDIAWPQQDRTPQRFVFSQVRDQLVCIDHARGVIPCR